MGGKKVKGHDVVTTTVAVHTEETVQEQDVEATEQGNQAVEQAVNTVPELDVQLAEQDAQVTEQDAQVTEQDVQALEQRPVSTASSKRQNRVRPKKRDCVKKHDSTKKRDSTKIPKYVGAYTEDGLLNIVYQVHEIIDDVYVLEAISYFDLIYFISSGYEPSSKPVAKMIRELKLSEIENPKLFYSWLGIASEFIRAEEERSRCSSMV